MVLVCSLTYPDDRAVNYKSVHDSYAYPLHDFQKWAVEAITTGNHVLICCPTGSGKTFGGEFAIDHVVAINKRRLIYTCPIKALANEKFNAFTIKFPHLTIGLCTGDIKCNPNADVIIMTTEILLNKLYQTLDTANTTTTPPSSSSSLSFEMDIASELGVVVFDEIHFINDAGRGHVWEQSLMMLPAHVQVVGLSATLDAPEKFAAWIENRHRSDKIVYLAVKEKRAVPLEHYLYVTTTATVFKHIKDKAIQKQIRDCTDKPIKLKSSTGKFDDTAFHQVHATLHLMQTEVKHYRPDHGFVINKLAKELAEKEMLPALCYVFSKRRVEKLAHEITASVLPFDSKVPYTVQHECEAILRTKLSESAAKEYTRLPDFIRLVQLLQRGVAIHHAGMVSVFREIVEILFARGFIKLLFCTETMSVGINLPVKTTIFTDISKWDGSESRILMAHEYTQASGRAGRLGLDSVGHVFLLPELFRGGNSANSHGIQTYRDMMGGRAQTLVSKFYISYQLMLCLIATKQSVNDILQQSMAHTDITAELTAQKREYSQLLSERNNAGAQRLMTSSDEAMDSYLELRRQIPSMKQNARKRAERELTAMVERNPCLQSDISFRQHLTELDAKCNAAKHEMVATKTYLEDQVTQCIDILTTAGCLTSDMELTDIGRTAGLFRETHCLVMAKWYAYERHALALHGQEMSPIELAMFFSCFCNFRSTTDPNENLDNASQKSVHAPLVLSAVLFCQNHLTYFCDEEIRRKLHMKSDDDAINVELVGLVNRWCLAATESECAVIVQDIEQIHGMFLGEFVKALLKIMNIVKEMEAVAEMMNDVDFLARLRQIGPLLLKHVVTNQSLYV